MTSVVTRAGRRPGANRRDFTGPRRSTALDLFDVAPRDPVVAQRFDVLDARLDLVLPGAQELEGAYEHRVVLPLRLPGDLAPQRQHDLAVVQRPGTRREQPISRGPCRGAHLDG